jgi:hypothetical protein
MAIVTDDKAASRDIPTMEELEVASGLLASELGLIKERLGVIHETMSGVALINPEDLEQNEGEACGAIPKIRRRIRVSDEVVVVIRTTLDAIEGLVLPDEPPKQRTVAVESQ